MSDDAIGLAERYLTCSPTAKHRYLQPSSSDKDHLGQVDAEVIGKVAVVRRVPDDYVCQLIYLQASEDLATVERMGAVDGGGYYRFGGGHLHLGASEGDHQGEVL